MLFFAFHSFIRRVNCLFGDTFSDSNEYNCMANGQKQKTNSNRKKSWNLLKWNQTTEQTAFTVHLISCWVILHFHWPFFPFFLLDLRSFWLHEWKLDFSLLPSKWYLSSGCWVSDDEFFAIFNRSGFPLCQTLDCWARKSNFGSQTGDEIENRGRFEWKLYAGEKLRFFSHFNQKFSTQQKKKWQFICNVYFQHSNEHFSKYIYILLIHGQWTLWTDFFLLLNDQKYQTFH